MATDVVVSFMRFMMRVLGMGRHHLASPFTRVRTDRRARRPAVVSGSALGLHHDEELSAAGLDVAREREIGFES